MTALQTPPSDDRLAELHALAAASLSGEPSDEEIARLERLVCEDQELCKLYVRYMYVSWNLRNWAKGPLAEQDAESGMPNDECRDVAAGPWPVTTGGLSQFSGHRPEGLVVENGTVPFPPPIVTDGQSGDWRSDDSFSREPAAIAPGSPTPWPIIVTDDQSEIPNPKSQIINPSPYLGFLGSAYHGVSGYIGDHDWAKGMLGGTVFLALLFAVLGSIEIFSRWRLANRPQPQDNQVVDVPAVRAARLTGVFDCRWTGSFHPPRNEVLNVDDYINLASGLAEVTYDSGAKVLLQGPCTYKIESPSSGYLKVGRLTARVGSKLPSPGTDRRLVGRGAGGEGGGAGNEELRTKKEELPAPTSSLLLPTSSFVVNTPSATVTDLGTEFGVHVDGAGATDSLVFVGSVKVNTVVGDGQKEAGEVTLIENQSARVERLGGKQYVVRRAVVKSDNFVRPDQIQDWVAMAREAAAKRKQEAEKPKEPEPDLTQFHKWEAFSNELRKRDALLAYYDFQYDPTDKRDADNHQLLRNKAKTAPGIFGRNYDGQLWGSINMGMIEGRFPGKTALKFDCRGDEIRLDIPVECKQITLAAWIRLNSKTNPVNTLLMSNGWNTPGQLCWQAYPAGSAAFGVVDGVPGIRSGLATRIEPEGEFCGHWRLVAVTSNPNAGKLAFYCDGQLVSEHTVAFGPSPAKLGQAAIGEWDPSGIGDAERMFQGDIDELMIFNAALSAEEIRRIYDEGKPATEKPKADESLTADTASLTEN